VGKEKPPPTPPREGRKKESHPSIDGWDSFFKGKINDIMVKLYQFRY